MLLDDKAIVELLKLSRIHCTDTEIQDLAIYLRSILSHIDELLEVDTQEVPPFAFTQHSLFESLREDLDDSTFDRQVFLHNAPEIFEENIKIPRY